MDRQVLTSYEDMLSAMDNPKKLTLEMIENWEKTYKEKTGREIGVVHVSIESLKIWIGE